jgi:hypothetical protein
MANVPGMVTGNVTGSTWQYNPQAEQFKYQQLAAREERAWRAREEQRMYELERQRRQQLEAEQTAKMREAFNVFHAPTLKSQWDVAQGQGVVGPRRPGGIPENWVAHMGDNRLTQAGQQGVWWGPRREIPPEMYKQQMQSAWDLWRAAKMLGIGPKG